MLSPVSSPGPFPTRAQSEASCTGRPRAGQSLFSLCSERGSLPEADAKLCDLATARRTRAAQHLASHSNRLGSPSRHQLLAETIAAAPYLCSFTLLDCNVQRNEKLAIPIICSPHRQTRGAVAS
eukprot:6177585-Pleurochrysis_carterae.AAC.1